MTNCRYVRVISPDIPSKTVASLHTVGQGCRVPLLVNWELKLKIGHVIKALRNRGCPHTPRAYVAKIYLGGVANNNVQVYFHTHVMLRYCTFVLHLHAHTHIMLRYCTFFLHLHTHTRHATLLHVLLALAHIRTSCYVGVGWGGLRSRLGKEVTSVKLSASVYGLAHKS